MANKVATTVMEAVEKLMTVKLKNKTALKRSYDNWQLKQMFMDRQRKTIAQVQKLDLDAHTKLGSDLAVAKFVISIVKGEVRNKRGNWIRKIKELPPDYSTSFKVTGIKATRGFLITEGIDNFVGLDYLETIDLSNNPALDDFACDQLARQFRRSRTLREINLSHNIQVSLNGLDALFRIPSLERIVAIGTSAGQHEEADVFVLAAEDERQCEVLIQDGNKKFRLPELENLRSVPQLTTS